MNRFTYLIFQVWNQIRPPWLHALLTPLYPLMVPIVATLLDAIRVMRRRIFTLLLIVLLGKLNDL